MTDPSPRPPHASPDADPAAPPAEAPIAGAPAAAPDAAPGLEATPGPDALPVADPSAEGRGAAPLTEPPSLTDAVGGPLGIAESALPAALFVGVYTLGGNETTPAAIVAVAVAAVLTVARLIRGQTLQFALSGLAGIALAGFIVSRTGRAEDFFLPGILINVGYAAAYLVSILVRWPLMGIVIASLGGQGMEWRKDPVLLRLYTRVSWVWVALFVLRLAVQLPLYLAGALVALGVAKVAMGIPLFVLGLWLSYLLVRRGTPQAPAAAA
ncbi:DUF3159 domain-containing protein [Patulibacter americanus]|uniref:DUF3159 domain-containing protein n=1 Tax=Patulibacter americanus TaxID=588672 RepID=UPI0003B4A595|nr:DUF3159 domain-containing protein [Patulibacter americanus]